MHYYVTSYAWQVTCEIQPAEEIGMVGRRCINIMGHTVLLCCFVLLSIAGHNIPGRVSLHYLVTFYPWQVTCEIQPAEKIGIVGRTELISGVTLYYCVAFNCRSNCIITLHSVTIRLLVKSNQQRR